MAFADGSYTIPFDSGTTLNQTRRLLRDFSLENNIDLAFNLVANPSKDFLITTLQKNNEVVLVSVGWLGSNDVRPIIEYGDEGIQQLGGTSGFLGGHVMVLGAYDLNHKNIYGESTPWGLLSSWNKEGDLDKIFWMSDENFFDTIGGLHTPNDILIVSVPSEKP